MHELLLSNSSDGLDGNPCFERISASILRMGSFYAAELITFYNKLNLRVLERNAFIVKQGNVCQSFYFVLSGSLRQYDLSGTGDENTLNFFMEDDWLLDYQSFTSQKPALGFIQAFEQTELLELTIHSFHELIQSSSSFFRIGKILESGIPQRQFLTAQTSPGEKYRALLRDNPRWLQKFPLKYIASFLQITPETLSRVRAKTGL